MRKDYKYVESATDLVLETTPKADKHLEEEVDIVAAEGGLVTETEDMLLALQQDYFIIPRERNAGLEDWHKAYLKAYEESYEAKSELTLDEFKKAFTDGLLSIRLCIWDEGVDLGDKSEADEDFPF
jgi:hypothetical protein